LRRAWNGKERHALAGELPANQFGERHTPGAHALLRRDAADADDKAQKNRLVVQRHGRAGEGKVGFAPAQDLAWIDGGERVFANEFARQRDFGIGRKHAVLAQKIDKGLRVGELARQCGAALDAGDQNHRDQKRRERGGRFQNFAQRLPQGLRGFERRRLGQRCVKAGMIAGRDHVS